MHALEQMLISHRMLQHHSCACAVYRHLKTCVLGQAVFGAPGTLGWAPSRLDAEVLWRMLGGALLALAPWTYSLKARWSTRSRPQQRLAQGLVTGHTDRCVCPSGQSLKHSLLTIGLLFVNAKTGQWGCCWQPAR